MHKSAITLVLTALLAVTTAFTSPSVSGRASSIAQRSAPAESAAFTSTLKEGRNRDVVVVKNALRELGNWNDVWDGDYGYGGGGYGMRGGCKLTGERGCGVSAVATVRWHRRGLWLNIDVLHANLNTLCNSLHY